MYPKGVFDQEGINILKTMIKRKLSEHFITTFDGIKIFYRVWLPDAPTNKAVILFHRGHEHSGRWDGLIEALAPDDAAVFAWDARGNGCSEGPRDDAEYFGVYAKDADLFVRHLSNTFHIPIENMIVVGHSVGAAVVATWVHDYAPQIRGMVLATPAFKIRLYIPFAISLLRLGLKWGIVKTVPSYVKARVLTHDPKEQEIHNRDSLITHSISTRILLDLFDTSDRIIDDAGAIQVPTFILVATKDWVVDTGVQRRFFQRLGSVNKEIEFLHGFFHDVYHEKGREQPLRFTRDFIEKTFKDPVSDQTLLQADKKGFTKDEYDQLNHPLALFSFKGLFFSLLKIFLATVGRLSYGIRLGWESGFNSGRTLDYVYENKARGAFVVGRWFDRSYLDGIGWQGIRVRKKLLEATLKKMIQQVATETQSVYLLDIATGAGRYILETINALKHLDVQAVLRDFEPKNLAEGQKRAQSLGLNNVCFIQGDAFDRKSIASHRPQPHIVIVSGLYELFPNNQMVINSLQGIVEVIAPGGILIYTNQPWHPQLELIARILCDWDGKPWIMRRRTQGEMDELVRSVGFEKMGMDIDPWGIFTVSWAQRV